MRTGAGLQNEQGTRGRLSYYSVVLKHHGQGKIEKEGFIQASGSRRLRVHHHHEWEVWQQADLTAGTAAESSHLESQAGSRECELLEIFSFKPPQRD